MDWTACLGRRGKLKSQAWEPFSESECWFYRSLTSARLLLDLSLVLLFPLLKAVIVLFSQAGYEYKMDGHTYMVEAQRD